MNGRVIVSSSNLPCAEVVEHTCIDCFTVFRDNSRCSLRCPVCRIQHLKVYNQKAAREQRARARQQKLAKEQTP